MYNWRKNIESKSETFERQRQRTIISSKCVACDSKNRDLWESE